MWSSTYIVYACHSVSHPHSSFSGSFSVCDSPFQSLVKPSHRRGSSSQYRYRLPRARERRSDCPAQSRVPRTFFGTAEYHVRSPASLILRNGYPLAWTPWYRGEVLGGPYPMREMPPPRMFVRISISVVCVAFGSWLFLAGLGSRL